MCWWPHGATLLLGAAPGQAASTKSCRNGDPSSHVLGLSILASHRGTSRLPLICLQVVLCCIWALTGRSVTGQVFAKPRQATPARGRATLCVGSLVSHPSALLGLRTSGVTSAPRLGGAALCQGESLSLSCEKAILSLFVPCFFFVVVFLGVLLFISQLCVLLLCSVSAGS